MLKEKSQRCLILQKLFFSPYNPLNLCSNITISTPIDYYLVYLPSIVDNDKISF